MDAIMLAAGLGTRLRPHTLHTPKPLLPVQDRPILDWGIAALPPQVDRVLVVIHYLGEQIEQYLRTQQHIPRWEVVRQETPRGTGDALLCCQDRIESDTFMVLNGDDLYAAADLQTLSECSAGILVHPVDEPARFGIAFPRPDGSLERLVEKPQGLTGQHQANTGAYLFPRKIFEHQLTLSERGEYEITEYVSVLATWGRVEVIPTRFWLPIGTEEVWQAAQNMDLTAVMR